MLTLNQGRRKNAAAGEPLHSPLGVMNESKTYLRKGQLTLIGAGPGSGKSALIQYILQKGNGLQPGNPERLTNRTFYFSADSDQTTMWKRSAAIATGHTQDSIDEALFTNNISVFEQAVTRSAGHMRFDYNSSPSDSYILDSIDAYASVYGSYPEVIVTDNLKNIAIEGSEGEFQALEEACGFLHDLARDTNAAVIALHHVTGENEDGRKPIPLSGLRGKVSKTPEVVLTLHRRETSMFMSPVKNRNGVADASGQWLLPVQVDLSRMIFTG
jgi:replicative DNA helicase